jgi:hypothetical protein
MSSHLRRYYHHWLRWHARVAEHLAMQQRPAWWC